MNESNLCSKYILSGFQTSVFCGGCFFLIWILEKHLVLKALPGLVNLSHYRPFSIMGTNMRLN